MPALTHADTPRLLAVLALGSALWLSQGAVADGSPSAQIRTPEELEAYFDTHAPETPEGENPSDDDDLGDEDDNPGDGDTSEDQKPPAEVDKPKRPRGARPTTPAPDDPSDPDDNPPV